MSHTVVIGAGPAGLTTAYELSKQRHQVTVLEPSGDVGGLFRTEVYQGYCIDLGAGGFSTQDESVQRLWDELAGEAAVDVAVRSRIHFRHRLFKHPLSLTNALKHLGPLDTAITGLSYLKSWLAAQQTPAAESHTSEAWVNKRFGAHLNRIFFEPYFEKVCGISGRQLAPMVASRSLTRPSGKDNTLIRAAIDAVIESPPQTVSYPMQGSGQVWRACQYLMAQSGAAFIPNSQALKLDHSGDRITQVIAAAGENMQTIPVDHLVSSLPLSELAVLLDAPFDVQQAARSLKHRHLIQVALVLDIAELFPEQWLYVNHPDVQVSRIQNFKNWSAAMAPDPGKTCLGVTYFCDEADARWQLSEAELVTLASQELVELGLIASHKRVESGMAVRQRHAYAVYTTATLQQRAIVQRYCDRFENLQTVGRQGLHHNAPLDHCMLNGQRAADNIVNEQADASAYVRRNLWSLSRRAVQQSVQTSF